MFVGHLDGNVASRPSACLANCSCRPWKDCIIGCYKNYLDGRPSETFVQTVENQQKSIRCNTESFLTSATALLPLVEKDLLVSLLQELLLLPQFLHHVSVIIQVGNLELPFSYYYGNSSYLVLLLAWLRWWIVFGSGFSEIMVMKNSKKNVLVGEAHERGNGALWRIGSIASLQFEVGVVPLMHYGFDVAHGLKKVMIYLNCHKI